MVSERLWLVSPVFFDVESYSRLRDNARAALAGSPGVDIRFVAVDDTAGADPAIVQLASAKDQVVIAPPFPLGHQRAIVFGLRHLSRTIDDRDLLVTLDADGEDRPEDLVRLLAPLLEQGASLRTVVIAARTRRRESLPFKVLYLFFKIFFRSLTGTIIMSGNYAAYRGWVARNVLFHPHFDLAYSSSLLSLGLKTHPVPCERGLRYAGRSKMTYLKLIQHGLRMLMPFADRIATRGIVVLSGLLGLSLASIAAIGALRLAGYATAPGWVVLTLCMGALLFALGTTGMVILFALFVQSQGTSLAQLDVSIRDADRSSAKPPPPA